MTNNTKENIIRYLTNNKKNENLSHDLVYSQTDKISINFASTLSSNYRGMNINGIIQGKNINGNLLNYSVAYGQGTKSDNTETGFIAIIDVYGNIVQLIEKFSSGVNFKIIRNLNVDENGNFYMVEEYDTTNTKFRFLLLNNIVVKREEEENYSVKIRKSYIIPDTTNLSNPYFLQFKKIIKAVGQSKYAFFYLKGIRENNVVYRVPAVTELTINVGTENEWKDYVSDINVDNNTKYSVTLLDSYATWNNDVLNFIILCSILDLPKKIGKYYNENDIVYYNNFDAFNDIINGDYSLKSAIILNNTNAYISINSQSVSNEIEEHEIQHVNLNNNTILWTKKTQGLYSDRSQHREFAGFRLREVNEEVMFLDTICTNISNRTYEIYIGRIRDDNYMQPNVYDSEILLTTVNNPSDWDLEFYNLYINKQFDLYNFNVLLGNYAYNTYQIYNRNNYNGTEFNNTKSLLPNSAILYNEDSKPIFARNLYNKIINDSTTVSVVEVPYNYINDITIAKQDLMSFNNNTLVDNEQNIVTNQYEELNINFINTISMSNQNDIERPILNRIGASRLNGSISDTLDYTNATLNKIRLIYEDNTTYVKEINPATQVSTYVYKYTFNVYNPSSNTIKEIELISHDENTTYQTIDFTNQASGKTYKISQNVEIQ